MGMNGDEPVERVGVFGGTFDPPHVGHVAVVEFLLSDGLVDRVLVIPTGQPWLRPAHPSASARDRLAMTRLAFAGLADVEVLDVEIRRDGPTYTVDTLRELRTEKGTRRHVLVLGIDAARTITKWHEYKAMLALCELLVVGRPGEDGLQDLSEDHPARRAEFVEGPLVSVSATEVRERLAAEGDVTGLLPAEVAAYVREHGLYVPETDATRETSSK